MRSVFETRFAKIGETAEHYRTYIINSTFDAVLFADQVLRGYFSDKKDAEELLVISLDTKHRPIRIVRATRGTLNASLIHPREVFRPAIHDAAASILLAHNHPSGDSIPSREDKQVTKRLMQAGEIVGIQVLDHIVVGDRCVSILESGL